MRWIVTLFGYMCSGCVATATYPGSWPEIAFDPSECPDISGVYDDVGSSALALERSDYAYVDRLSLYFFELSGDAQTAFGGIVTTAVSHPVDGSMLIESTDAQDQVVTRTLEFDIDYTCRDGRIWVSDRRTEGGEGAFIVGRARIGLARTEAGSLVGETREKFAGFAFIIPVIGSETDYVLWERE
jgi:hypothetical protein